MILLSFQALFAGHCSGRKPSAYAPHSLRCIFQAVDVPHSEGMWILWRAPLNTHESIMLMDISNHHDCSKGRQVVLAPPNARQSGIKSVFAVLAPSNLVNWSIDIHL